MKRKLSQQQIEALRKLDEEWARTPHYGWRCVGWWGIRPNTADSLCNRGLLEMDTRADGHNGYPVYRITIEGRNQLAKAMDV